MKLERKKKMVKKTKQKGEKIPIKRDWSNQ